MILSKYPFLSIATLSTIFSIGFSFSSSVLAATIGTQDIFIIEGLYVDSAGGTINIVPQLISEAQTSLGSTIVNLPGGATFTSTDAIEGRSGDGRNFLLENTEIIPGIFNNAGTLFFGVLASSDLESGQQTINGNDVVEFDVDSILPSDVQIGDTGSISYTFIQLLAPLDPSSEEGLSPVEIAASRANLNLIQAPSFNNSTIAAAYNAPLVIGEGSDTARYVGKGLAIVGTTGLGALGAGPLGACFGACVGIGGALVSNNPPNNPNPQPPNNPVPKPDKLQPVPEPLTLFGTGTALGFGAFFKRKLKPFKSSGKGTAKIG